MGIRRWDATDRGTANPVASAPTMIAIAGLRRFHLLFDCIHSSVSLGAIGWVQSFVVN